MQDPRNLSWSQFNQARRFPLMCDATARSVDGHFVIPDDLLVGIYLAYGSGSVFNDPGGFYLGSLVYYRTGLILSVYYDGTKVAETTIDLTSDQRVATLLGFNNQFFYGYVVLGCTLGLEKQPAGEWSFDRENAGIDPFCVRPSAEEISALYVQDSGKTLGPFYGDITLSAGENVNLNVRSAENSLHCLDDPPSGRGTEVIISSKEASNETETFNTLNTVTPDKVGNLTIIGRSCLDIITQPDQSTIILDDKCAEPCCTCKELVPIQEKIDQITQSISSIESHLNTLTLQSEFLTQALSFVK